MEKIGAGRNEGLIFRKGVFGMGMDGSLYVGCAYGEDRRQDKDGEPSAYILQAKPVNTMV